MEVEFNAKTEQFVTKTFSFNAPELSAEQVDDIKSSIMADLTHKHEDQNGVTYYFSYEEHKRADMVRVSVIIDDFKSSYLFFQDSLFEALDEIAEFYSAQEDDSEDEDFEEMSAEEEEFDELSEEEEEY
jgi:hypothetical protein